MNKTETIYCSDQSLNGSSKKEQELARRIKISERLKRDQKSREEKPRSLSHHVVSRFYRSPEVIMLEKNYDQKVTCGVWAAYSRSCFGAVRLWLNKSRFQKLASFFRETLATLSRLKTTMRKRAVMTVILTCRPKISSKLYAALLAHPPTRTDPFWGVKSKTLIWT